MTLATRPDIGVRVDLQVEIGARLHPRVESARTATPHPPCLLAGDQTVAQIEAAQHAEPDRRPVTVDAK